MCFECSEERQLKVETCQSRHFSRQYVHIFDRHNPQRSGKRCQSCSGLLVNISKIYGNFYYIFWGGLPKEQGLPGPHRPHQWPHCRSTGRLPYRTLCKRVRSHVRSPSDYFGQLNNDPFILTSLLLSDTISDLLKTSTLLFLPPP
jgi:hypothetical protein